MELGWLGPATSPSFLFPLLPVPPNPPGCEIGPALETGRHLLLPGARSKRTFVDLHIANLLGFLFTKLICQEP